MLETVTSTSGPTTNMKFLKFVEMKIERAELEGSTVPVTEPALTKPLPTPVTKGYGKSSLMPKMKAKSQPSTLGAPQFHLHEDSDEFEEDYFQMLNPLETEKDAEIECLQARMLNIENALQQVICHLGAQQTPPEQ